MARSRSWIRTAVPKRFGPALTATVATCVGTSVMLSCGGPDGREGTLAGVVAAGPTCPSERVTADRACDDRPVSGARLRILAGDDDVRTVRTDGGGRFAVTLPEGTYRLE